MTTRIYESRGLYVTAVTAAAIEGADRRRLEFCTSETNPRLDAAEVRALLVRLSEWLYSSRSGATVTVDPGASRDPSGSGRA